MGFLRPVPGSLSADLNATRTTWGATCSQPDEPEEEEEEEEEAGGGRPRPTARTVRQLSLVVAR